MADNLAYQQAEYRDEIWSETLNGSIVLMAPRPAVNHTRAAFNIACAFTSYLRGKTCEAFSDGIDVYLTKDDIVVPDAMIVCNKDIIKRNGIYGAPDLIVEVLSRSTEKWDKGYKKKLYEQCGVREYWIVDPDAKYIEVYLLKNGEFVLDDIYRLPPNVEDLTPDELESYKTEVPVSLYDSFSVPLEEIFWNLS